MNTIAKNKQMWSEFHWDTRGEHWSLGWGNSDAQWNFCVRPRIARHLPADSILEIATGFGRWTKYLVHESNRYAGFDLAEKCAAYCAQTYGGPNRTFTANDGLHLTGIPDHTIDFVFSMDSLVHVDWPTLKSYLAETLRVLKPGGTAVLHHSNAAENTEAFNRLDPPSKKAFRAADVSAELVREEIKTLGGGVYAQELVNWGSSGELLIDCFSTITTELMETTIVRSPTFMADMRRIAGLSSIYTSPDDPAPSA